MTTNGLQIPTFRKTEEDWYCFWERLNSYYAVKKIKDEERIHHLIIGLQAKTYQTLKDLVAPLSPTEKNV